MGWISQLSPSVSTRVKRPAKDAVDGELDSVSVVVCDFDLGFIGGCLVVAMAVRRLTLPVWFEVLRSVF